MLQATGALDPGQAVGPIDRRLFGSFVEYLGRCVYGGIYDRADRAAGGDGVRTDVLDLVHELGVTVVRYPGGNFVSGYRWEDGIGPVADRPRRLNLAWHQTESNEFGLHEFMAWVRRTGAEPILTINLGTRGILEALDLIEYVNHPGGTTLADLRAANGDPEPFGVRFWCLGNEPDGPWQLGHMTALEYGRLAAETARAIRQFDPSLQLVVNGSTAPWLPSSADWDQIVLRETVEFVDLMVVHNYVEEVEGDLASFLASGVELDREIDRAITVADAAAVAAGLDRRLKISIDEWGVWRARLADPPTPPDWPVERRLMEAPYNGADAVVAGSMLATIVGRADRVAIACQSLLVNASAAIRAEPGAAWRQSIFHPVALTARHARGTALRLPLTVETLETSRYGAVPAAHAVAAFDETSGALTVIAVNRHPVERIDLSIGLAAWPDATLVESFVIGGDDVRSVNTAEDPEVVVPRPNGSCAVGAGALTMSLPAASWNLVRIATR